MRPLRLRVRTLMALVAVAAAVAAAIVHKSRAVKRPTPYDVPVDYDRSIHDANQRDMGPQYPHLRPR